MTAQEENFDQLKNKLADQILNLSPTEPLPEEFKSDFLKLIEMVTFSLMHKEDNFFGSCTIQMKREIRPDIHAAVGVTAELSHFILHFNPKIFLSCNLEQMKAEIKHQIYHIMMRHIERSAKYKNKVSPLILNTAMDISINQFVDNMPAWAMTLPKAEVMFDVRLPPNQPFEVYCDLIQEAVNKKKSLQNQANCVSSKGTQSDEDRDNKEWGSNEVNESDRLSYNKPGDDPERDNDGTGISNDQLRCHDIWGESNKNSNLENLLDLTKNMANNAARGVMPAELQEAIDLLNSKPELKWQDILKNMVGTLPIPYKKTITRKDRRQPERHDLRGKLPRHIIKLLIAIDTSGSVDKEILEKAIGEVLDIVKNYKHEIMLIECDAKIQRVYKIKTAKDVKLDIKGRGGTKFSPVFEYIQQKGLRQHLLIYFTDGYGEKELTIKPINFRTMWILTGSKNQLSLREPYGVVKKMQ